MISRGEKGQNLWNNSTKFNDCKVTNLTQHWSSSSDSVLAPSFISSILISSGTKYVVKFLPVLQIWHCKFNL